MTTRLRTTMLPVRPDALILLLALSSMSSPTGSLRWRRRWRRRRCHGRSDDVAIPFADLRRAAVRVGRTRGAVYDTGDRRQRLVIGVLETGGVDTFYAGYGFSTILKRMLRVHGWLVSIAGQTDV